MNEAGKSFLRAVCAGDTKHLRALRFIGVGGTSTVVYWVVILAVAGLGHVKPIMASVIAYLMGFMTAYFGHRRFTYRSAAPFGAELRRFLTIHAVCFTLGNLMFWYIVSRLGAHFLLGGAALTAASFAITYTASELWVFQGASRERQG